MPLYRKKPVVIDAVRYDGEWKPVMAWLDHLAGGRFGIPIGTTPPIQRDPITKQVVIHTLEGTMRANVGDWIIKGVQGEFYPCRDDIFRQTYEPADA